jgi:tyrosine-protein kinase Etk/Wzc
MAFSPSSKEDLHPVHQPAGYEGMAPKPMWSYPPMYPQPQDEEASVLDYWRALAKRKWQILLFTVLGTALGLGSFFLMPRKFKVEVSLMTISSSGGGGLGGLASQVSSMPLMGGALGDLGKMGSGKSKELVNILKSRTLSEKIIQHFDLMKVLFAKQYDPKTNSYFPGFPAFLKPIPVMEDAVSKFQKKVVRVEEEKKSTLIKISVNMKDPALAAKVANRMVLELQDFIENNSLTISKRNRIFLEEQLVRTRVKLLEAGKELNQFYAENRISSVVPQIDVDVGTYQTTSKPFAEFQEEFDQLSEKEKEIAAKKEQARVSRVPGQIYLQFLTISRELQIKTYGLLTQQYELAKIEEAKEDLAFQVIDKAEVKVRPTSPKLIINLPAGIGGGLFLGVLVALLRDFIQKAKEKEARLA